MWIDVLDDDGKKLGDGPIVTATNWQCTPQLDRAGSFSFALPKADPKAALLRVFRRVQAWEVSSETLVYLGGGIVGGLTTTIGADGWILNVSGDDELIQLADVSVGELALHDEVVAHPSQFLEMLAGDDLEDGDDITGRFNLDDAIMGAVGDISTSVTLSGNMGNTPQWYVVKYPIQFRGLRFTITSGTGQGFDTASSVVIDYWNGEAEQWDGLNLTTETTRAKVGFPLSQSGDWLWDLPSGWGIREGEYSYKIRWRLTGNYGCSVSDLAIIYDEPTRVGLERIMSKAPAGWTIDAAHGHTATASATELGDNIATANTGFEDYTGTPDNNVSDTFTDWTVADTNDGAGNRVEATATADTGSAAVKITNTTLYAVPKIYQAIDVDPATDYLLTMRTRGDGTHDGYYVIATDSTRLHRMTPFTLTGITDTSYATYQHTFTTSPNLYQIHLELRGPDYVFAGTAYWDNISLRRRMGGEVYLDLFGESCLAALGTLAEQTGEHFIKSPYGLKQVLWLGTDVRSSGIRAVTWADPIAVEDEPDLCLITSLSETQEKYELCSRVRPWGGGTGGSRPTLRYTTRTAPDGYTLDKEAGWLIRDQSEDEYYREKELDFPDINALSPSASQLEMAGNALFDRCYAYLVRHSAINLDPDTGDVPRSFRIGLVGCNRLVLPGHTIRAVCRNYVAGERVYNLDRDLWVLAPTLQVDQAGIRTTQVIASTVDAWPSTDADLVARYLRQFRAMRSHGAAEDALSSAAVGTVTGLDVRGGRVIRVHRTVV